jgi:hypothetical protein
VISFTLVTSRRPVSIEAMRGIQAAEADRGRHPGFSNFNVVAGGPGSLAERSATRGERMEERPTVAEMRARLAECARHYGGSIPQDAALVWDGYFAALIEWGLISPAEHAELLALLPEIPDCPVVGVFLGWERKQAEPVAADVTSIAEE